jgi:hypothetical protein
MKSLIEILEALLLVSVVGFVICLMMAMYYIGFFIGGVILQFVEWIQKF